ncbi:hypothetical protein H8356DRAFT_1638542 [Neocallimastix lanati (nom. inval.)]|nr:hypothetical protein H8356DRAFT_1638542 [Neocallimastix sp. JGI-2020a]
MNVYLNLIDFINRFQTTIYTNELYRRDETFNINDYNIPNNILYKKCMSIIDNNKDWKYILGIDNVLGKNIILGIYIFVLVYIFITLILLIKNSDQFMISIRGPSFSIMICIGCMMIVVAGALRKVNL